MILTPRRIVLIHPPGKERDALVAALNRSDLKMKTADNGQSGVNLAEHQRAHLIILVPKLTDMTGIKCCELLRQKPDLVKTPILILADNPGLQTFDAFMKTGASEILARNQKKDVFSQKVISILDGSPVTDPLNDCMVKVECGENRSEGTILGFNRQRIFMQASEEWPEAKTVPLWIPHSKNKPTKVWVRIEKCTPSQSNESGLPCFHYYLALLGPIDDFLAAMKSQGGGLIQANPAQIAVSIGTHKGFWVALIIVALGTLGFNYYQKANPPPSSEVPDSALVLQTPIPKTRIKTVQKDMIIFLSPEWNQLEPGQKEELAQGVLQELKGLNLYRLTLMTEEGILRGTGTVGRGMRWAKY